jgi:hypothetical protein
MRNGIVVMALAVSVGVVALAGQPGGDQSYTPTRINKAIELLA